MAATSRFQVAVGRGDDARVERDLSFEEPIGRTLRSCRARQQLGLHRQGHLANLVQEQRPAIGGDEQTLTIAARIRKRAPDVTEQLALEQCYPASPRS